MNITKNNDIKAIEIRLIMIVKYCCVYKVDNYSYNSIQLCLKIVELKRYCNKSFIDIVNILYHNNFLPKSHYKDMLRLYNKQQHFIDSLLS